ncbi:MAG: type IV pilus twitching motility protein PilT, partial [Coprobacillaceae bacterium]
MTIIEILNKAVQNGASDILITTGSPPIARINGSLMAMSRDVLDGNDTEKYARDLTTNAEFKKFFEEKELDIAFQTMSAGRFRVNMFFQQGNPAIVMRSIKTEIPTFDEIKLPKICRELCNKKRGMILVTGPTGSGKSTTLAAMINEINMTRNEHIITIEDPTEYVHKHRKSIISQREVGKDTFSFDRALRAALREDPDIILVGEMRDLETISIASTAAETGHLLFSTLHTIGAAKTIDR